MVDRRSVAGLTQQWKKNWGSPTKKGPKLLMWLWAREHKNNCVKDSVAFTAAWSVAMIEMKKSNLSSSEPLVEPNRSNQRIGSLKRSQQPQPPIGHDVCVQRKETIRNRLFCPINVMWLHCIPVHSGLCTLFFFFLAFFNTVQLSPQHLSTIF